MVGRVTTFEKIPARQYYLYLFGTVEDTGLKKVAVGNYSLMQKVTVEKNKTREILFQVEKEEAFTRVYIRRGESELNGVE